VGAAELPLLNAVMADENATVPLWLRRAEKLSENALSEETRKDGLRPYRTGGMAFHQFVPGPSVLKENR